MKTLKIDFVSDVACPWCAVGLNALERALERTRPELDAELHFQPFELNPTMPAEGVDTVQYLANKYGITPSSIQPPRTGSAPTASGATSRRNCWWARRRRSWSVCSRC